MEIVEAAAKEIALVAAGFGLAAATVDNAAGNVLYDLDPDVTFDLVGRARTTYRTEAKAALDRVRTEGETLVLIQEYARLCTPIRIETFVKQSLRAATAKPDASMQALAQKSEAIVAPRVIFGP